MITRFNRISIFGSTLNKKVKIKKPVYSEEYIIDRSHFCPVSEALASQKLSPFTASESELCFDFPDGRDNGMRLPAVRLHDVKDLAEVSVALRSETQIVENIYQSELVKAQDKEFYESLKNSSHIVPSSSASSAPSAPSNGGK